MRQNTSLEKEFLRYYETKQDYLHNICMGILHDPEDAREAVQDGILKCWKYLDNLKDQTKLATWIYRTMVNTCISILRQRHGVRVYIERQDDASIDPNHQHFLGIEECIHTHEVDIVKRLMLSQALSTLTNHQARLLYLRVVENVRLEVLSRELLCPVGTLKSQLFRIKVKLRKKLS